MEVVERLNISEFGRCLNWFIACLMCTFDALPCLFSLTIVFELLFD